MRCITCGDHFFKSPYDNGKQCFNCQDVLLEDEDDLRNDLFEVVNPTGKTKAYIEDADDQS